MLAIIQAIPAPIKSSGGRIVLHGSTEIVHHLATTGIARIGKLSDKLRSMQSAMLTGDFNRSAVLAVALLRYQDFHDLDGKIAISCCIMLQLAMLAFQRFLLTLGKSTRDKRDMKCESASAGWCLH
ncbi:hypothetical protein SAZ10_29555 [Mesorhizobium sp. BAC0120]|uniref:hypothetical protein n=1 Tax=Mesorhizobium sp. BAC0120 TaxID=3090670 RepID=UPI00298C38D6|nr:hypothetical protein [Mesorhizobium sp. BAC0120]MDW6025913.1 hypothetical protein [Mesorhizobium sp. BAC0120]